MSQREELIALRCSFYEWDGNDGESRYVVLDADVDAFVLKKGPEECITLNH